MIKKPRRFFPFRNLDWRCCLLPVGTVGWGSFQLGYSGNADLEPGRCRRTDGKKWRCSRDAVADQKYCERHMNRGRHRSRKHVEDQPGHAAKAMSAVAVAAAAAAATQHAAALAGAGATAAAGLAVNRHRQPGKSYATGATDPCSLQYSRELANKLSNESENMQDSDNVSMLTSMNTGNTAGSVFPFSKQNTALFEVSSSRPEFGLVPSDSLTSSPHSSLKSVKNLLSSRSLSEHQSSASLQHFVDWPRTPPAQGGLSWPEAEDMPRAQRSQLSVSAPMASSELSSASTSPIHDHEKLILSPLKLGREYTPSGVVSAAANRYEVSQLEATWATMFRDSSTGGPLGEVLAKNNSNAEARGCPSAAPPLTDYYCWDSGHGMQSSPVGVLQRTTAFGSVSSSTGSSPRVENHGACCDGTSNLMDDLGSVVVRHPSIRLL
nr:unknown [Zea mays]